TPNISAHARVAIQSIDQASNLRPLAVRDPNAIPCVKVTFVPVNGGASHSIQLARDSGQTTSNGPDVWDNSGDNGGNGDQIGSLPAGNVYMQTVLYAQGSDGTCNTMS